MKNNKNYPTKNQLKNEKNVKKDIIISDVKNIHELPIFLASNPKQFTVEIKFDPVEHPEGGTQERVVNISPLNIRNSSGEEVPLYLNSITLEFWFWLCWLWQQMPEPDRSKGIVRWTRYEILKLMGKSTGGDQCKIHDDHMTRLAGVSSEIKDCFFNKVNNERLKKVRRFVILSALELTEMRDGEVVMLDQCYAVINPLLVDNFLHHYTKPINLSVYSSIPSKAGIARKLYARLDVQFSYYDRFEMTTERFFRESGIVAKKYAHPANRKQNFEKAVKNLQAKKFSSNKIIKNYKFEKTADGKDWKIIVWAHKIELLSLTDIKIKSIPKIATTKQIKISKNPTFEARSEPREIPRKETILPTQQPLGTNPELKTFLATFAKLFSKADKEIIYRSRSVKSKAESFIKEHGIRKALDFLRYAQSKSKQPHFSKLTEAETPNFLINSKLGSGGLVNTWLEDRALALRMKKEEQIQEQRRKQVARDNEYKRFRGEYESYVLNFVEEIFTIQNQEKENFSLWEKEKIDSHLIKLEKQPQLHTTMKRHLQKQEQKVARIVKYFKSHSTITILDFWQWYQEIKPYKE